MSAPGRTPPVVVGYTAGQAASGRWWVTCPRPACIFYRGGLTKAQATRLGEFHDDMHRQRLHPNPQPHIERTHDE